MVNITKKGRDQRSPPFLGIICSELKTCEYVSGDLLACYNALLATYHVDTGGQVAQGGTGSLTEH